MPGPVPALSAPARPILDQPPGRLDADTHLVVVVGRPLPGNRNDCKAFGESGAEHAS
jgi:hypothetical protein